MKRFFVILIMLMLVGATYADGPRYRFKSRRALQSLWRNEMAEKAQDARTGQQRSLSVRELQGENAEEKENKPKYGVVVANPFSDAPSMGRGMHTMGDTPGSVSGKPGTIGGNGGTTTGGSGWRPLIDITDPSEEDDPAAGGTVGGGGQSPYAPPKTPVGDGICCMILFSAILIAIKKRLS